MTEIKTGTEAIRAGLQNGMKRLNLGGIGRDLGHTNGRG